jgi:membrane-bound ClpP family serine protease
MGRRVIGTPSDEELETKRLAELRERERLTGMVGKEGTVLTALRPVGLIEIDGVRMDALSETMFVQPGSKVKVTYADGSQIKVRQIN